MNACNANRCQQGRLPCPPARACRTLTTGNGGNSVSHGQPLTKRQFTPDVGIEHKHRRRWWHTFPVVRTAFGIGVFLITIFLVAGLVAGHFYRA